MEETMDRSLLCLVLCLVGCATTQEAQPQPQGLPLTISAGGTALFPYVDPRGNLGVAQGGSWSANVPVEVSMCPSPCGDRAPAGYLCYRPCMPRVAQ